MNARQAVLESLWKFKRRVEEVITTPGGQALYVRELSGAERDEAGKENRKAMAAYEKVGDVMGDAEYYARAVCRCLCDAEGNAALDVKDWGELLSLPAETLKVLFDGANKLNHFIATDDPEKN